MPLTVPWSISIAGKPATSAFNPYVVEIEVTDGSGEDGDSARITLRDDGRIIMPRKGAEITISILGQQVFTGILKSPRCTTAKGQGGLMMLNATGHDTEGKGKEGQRFVKEDGTLEEYLTGLGKKAGFTVKIDPALAKIKRTLWASDGRSFLHHAQQLATENGATLKISGKKAVIAKRGAGMTPSGKALPTIRATAGVNLISADIEPFEASAVYRDVRFSFFDRKKAKFEEEKADIRTGAGSSGGATAVLRGKAAYKQDAKDRSEGRKNEAERDKGGGSVEIQIEPLAKAEGTCILAGVRAGIGGSYRIESATHTLRAAESGGASTKLTLKQPDDKAGKDDRKAGDTE
nr:late control D family protein [Methylobacterium sp. OTU13CASTA1]